jgi:cytochrome c biogenesis protein CcmG, thiol:disulfide interchange protein DsbE
MRQGVLAHVCLVLLLGTACGSAGSMATSASEPALPQGFTRSTDRSLGFEIGLAPGWKVSAYDAQGSVDYSGPDGLEMVVHYEQATSTQLDAASAPVLAELTGGNAMTGGKVTAGRLTGRPAVHATGQVAAAAQQQEIQAYVTIDRGLAWEVAMAGPAQPATAATATFDQMVSTFRLLGAQPSPPPRASVGLPAPGFPALQRTAGPVVVNFFATWCADCRGDMPEIANAAIRSRGRFTVLGVDCCDDKPSSVTGFLQQLGVRDTFRNVTYDNDGRIAQAYGLLGPPTTAFLDRDHVLRQLVVGPVTAASLQEGLRDAGVS